MGGVSIPSTRAVARLTLMGNPGGRSHNRPCKQWSWQPLSPAMPADVYYLAFQRRVNGLAKSSWCVFLVTFFRFPRADLVLHSCRCYQDCIPLFFSPLHLSCLVWLVLPTTQRTLRLGPLISQQLALLTCQSQWSSLSRHKVVVTPRLSVYIQLLSGFVHIAVCTVYPIYYI